MSGKGDRAPEQSVRKRVGDVLREYSADWAAKRLSLIVLALAILTQDSVKGATAATNEPCAAEMRLLQEQARLARTDSTEGLAAADDAIIRTVSRWDRKTGVCAQDAAKLLQYVAEQAGKTLYTRIEIRWSDGFRGVVALVKETAKSHGTEVWYLFRYQDKWRVLMRAHQIG